MEQCRAALNRSFKSFTVMFQIYAAFWVTGNFKTGINLENFPVELNDIQKFSLF